MDSLMAVELRLALETKLGIDVPLVSLSDNTSLAILAKRLVRNLSKDSTPVSFVDVMSRHENAAAVAKPVADRLNEIAAE
jgi:hypothetical protein